jgi:RNA polymerase sigma-70 factor (ECF subfamily)
MIGMWLGRAMAGPEKMVPGDCDQGSRLAWAQLKDVTDNELMHQFASGNHDAFAVIVDRYQRLVFSVALRLVQNEGEAEDVVQIVFLDIFQKAAQFDPSRGTLKVWLLQFAYTRSINRRYYLQTRGFYFGLDFEPIDPDDCPVGDARPLGLSTGESARLVSQALNSISPKQRKALELVYFQGLTFSEAARRESVSLDSMKHHYYRGMALLREFISAERQDLQAQSLSSECTVGLEVRNLKARPV